MTKRKLRKNADISPPQSPHDGIHTCSKGCKKPGCTRTLRDTIEEQNQQIEALKRDVLEKTAELRNLKEVVAELRISAEDDLDSIETARIENARLKAEVERLTEITTRTIIPNEELQAHVKRLTKAGDAMAKEWLNCESLYHGNEDFIEAWNAAKEGKGQP
jgi:predicted RNase H-like nuclease (RuvC/YqgF family)